MCGIFGIINVRKAAEDTVAGLHGIQHRAIDFAGIVSSDGYNPYRWSDKGIARKVFSGETLNRLHGMDALGHIRYATVKNEEYRDNTQPIMGIYNNSWIALAHNGNLTNVDELKGLMPERPYATSMDSEMIVRLLEHFSTGNLEADLKKVFSLLKGSYNLGILTPGLLIVVRGPSGTQPISMARLKDGYCISSETCVFPNLDAEFISDIDAGTMVFITKDGYRTVRFAPARLKKCRFEGIYYSHPFSEPFGESVGEFRIRLGRALEEYAPAIGADVVTSVPDSANFIALGYGESGRSGRCLQEITRSHYVGRSFIAADQANRDAEVVAKFTFWKKQIEGKSIVVVDDSIVRATTMPKIVSKLWKLGAREVHVRSGGPAIISPCLYGINTPDKDDLVSSHSTPEELGRSMGATSLEFLPFEVLKTLSPDPDSYCFACMNSEYWHEPSKVAA